MNAYTVTMTGSYPDALIFAAVSAGTIPAPDYYCAVVGAGGTMQGVRLFFASPLTVTQQTNLQALADTNPDPANAPWKNAATVQANIAAALTRLRQIQTQAQTFQAQAPYGAATLANLNDLLAKTQLIAGAVNDLAADLVGIARLLSGQFDNTN